MTHRRPLVRFSISVFIAAHFAVLGLNNLSWSPMIERLFPYYGWYTASTGQIQGWGMYKFPMHQDTHYEVSAVLPNGTVDAPVGVQAHWDARYLYFVEALFVNSNGPAVADDYFKILYDRAPLLQKPKGVTIVKSSRPILDPGARGPSVPLPFRVEKELSKTW